MRPRQGRVVDFPPNQGHVDGQRGYLLFRQFLTSFLKFRSAGLEGRAVAGACGRAARKAQAKRATPAPSSTPVTWPQGLPAPGAGARPRGAHTPRARAGQQPGQMVRLGRSVRVHHRAGGPGPGRPGRAAACGAGGARGQPAAGARLAPAGPPPAGPEGRARAAARLPSGGLSPAGRLPGPRRSRSSSAEGALLPMDGREPGARWVQAARGAAAAAPRTAASGAPQGVGAGSHRRPTSRSAEKQALQARGRDALPRAQSAGPPRTDPERSPWGL